MCYVMNNTKIENKKGWENIPRSCRSHGDESVSFGKLTPDGKIISDLSISFISIPDKSEREEDGRDGFPR